MRKTRNAVIIIILCIIGAGIAKHRQANKELSLANTDMKELLDSVAGNPVKEKPQEKTGKQESWTVSSVKIRPKVVVEEAPAPRGPRGTSDFKFSELQEAPRLSPSGPNE